MAAKKKDDDDMNDGPVLSDDMEDDEDKDDMDDDEPDEEPSTEDEPVDIDKVLESEKEKVVISRRSLEEMKNMDEHPLDSFGMVRKAFILDNIRTIDYNDLAKLLGIEVDDLKQAVEKAGIRLPIERALPWDELDIGTFRSLLYCARCPVQLDHIAFHVGQTKCKKCLERNIKLWIEKDIIIRFPFSR